MITLREFQSFAGKVSVTLKSNPKFMATPLGRKLWGHVLAADKFLNTAQYPVRPSRKRASKRAT